MAGEIVEDDDVALVEGRDEYILNVDTEEIAVDRSIDDPWSVNAIMAQCCNKGHGFPMTVWHKCFDPFAFWSPTAQRGHVGFHPGFVQKHQALRVDLGLVGFPALALAGDIRAVLFGRQYRFF